MIKNAFIESLKIVDGRFIHPELHWQRITDTQRVHFGNSTFLPLSSESIPPDKRLGTLKCRIIYDQEIKKNDHYFSIKSIPSQWNELIMIILF